MLIITCMYKVLDMHALPTEVIGSLWAAMWVLGTAPRSSIRAANTLDHKTCFQSQELISKGGITNKGENTK